MLNDILDIKITESSPTEPVTIAEAKAWCIVDTVNTDDDSLITALITKVRKAIENKLRICLVPKKVILTADWRREWKLPWGPHYTIDDVAFKDSFSSCNFSSLTVGTDYSLDGELFKTLNILKCGRIKVSYRSGYGNSGLVLPDDLKSAIEQEICFRYEHRGDQQDIKGISPGAEAYLQQYKSYAHI